MPKSNGRPPERRASQLAPAVEQAPAPDPAYFLNPLERAQFSSLMIPVRDAKAALWDAQNALQAAQNNLFAALRSLASEHGMNGDVEMAADFSRIWPKGTKDFQK